MNFFIIGLPRSRTAWLANFLTYGQLCYHEGLNGCNSLKEYREKLGENNGDSSTGLMLLDMNKEFPDSPKVIIESDPQRAVEWAQHSFGYSDPSHVLLLQERMDYIEGLRVKYEDIDDRLEEIWGHLIGTSFDPERAEMLKQLNIQVSDVHNVDEEAAVRLWNTLN